MNADAEVKRLGGRHGRVELVAIARRFALEEGTSLDMMLWRMVKTMIAQGTYEGDMKAADLVLKMFARESLDVPDRSTQVAVAVNVGASIPTVLPEYTERVARTIADLEGKSAARFLE